jgi:hypothetical protein
MANGLPSLDLVATIVREAGIVLGFAGAIAALTATRGGAFFVAAAGMSVGAALLAMAAFFPRPSPVLNIENLRDKYLVAEERITKLVLVDTEIELRKRTRSLVRLKSLLLGMAMASLALAVVLVLIAAILRVRHLGKTNCRRRSAQIPTSSITWRTTSDSSAAGATGRFETAPKLSDATSG